MEKLGKIIKSPEEILELLKKYFNKDRKFIFLLAIILGIITHFVLLSNLILSQDGLYNGIHYTAGGYEATLGRWGINLFDSLRNNIAFPFITTLISIVILAFSINFIIDLFEIKGKIFKVLTTLILVVSPSLCITLLYTYTADVYFFSLFFSIFTVYSIYKIKNKKLGFFLGMISFVLMLSTYQSYMGVTVGLILMLAIKKLLTEEKSSLGVLKDLCVKAIFLFLYVIAYYLVTKIILKIMNLNLSTYGGLNGIGFLTILNSLGTSIKSAYVAFSKYFFADGIILNRIWNRDKLYIIFFAIYFISMIVLFIKNLKSETEKVDVWKRYIFIAIITLLLPIALNLVLIAAPGNKIYYLTATQMSLIIPLVFMIFENLPKNTIITNLLNWGIIAIVIIISVTYFLSIVVTYQTTELSYNQARSIATRMIERMEEYPGYSSGMNKLFAGIIDDTNFPKQLDIYNYGITNSLRTSLFHATYLGQMATWQNFMELFCGTHINFCEDYEYYEIVNSEEFEQMDIFPGENSVKIINNVMVVKFTETPELPPYSENMALHGVNFDEYFEKTR